MVMQHNLFNFDLFTQKLPEKEQKINVKKKHERFKIEQSISYQKHMRELMLPSQGSGTTAASLNHFSVE